MRKPINVVILEEKTLLGATSMCVDRHVERDFLYLNCSGKIGKDADSGTYYCVARNRYGEARSREAVLRIAMLRDDFLTRPRNVQVHKIWFSNQQSLYFEETYHKTSNNP
jgi:hypothetical protein